jgi:hypothetical protein
VWAFWTTSRPNVASATDPSTDNNNARRIEYLLIDPALKNLMVTMLPKIILPSDFLIERGRERERERKKEQFSRPSFKVCPMQTTELLFPCLLKFSVSVDIQEGV